MAFIIAFVLLSLLCYFLFMKLWYSIGAIQMDNEGLQWFTKGILYTLTICLVGSLALIGFILVFFLFYRTPNRQ